MKHLSFLRQYTKLKHNQNQSPQRMLLAFDKTVKYFSQPKRASYKCKVFTHSFKCKNLELLSQHTTLSFTIWVFHTSLVSTFSGKVLLIDNTYPIQKHASHCFQYQLAKHLPISLLRNQMCQQITSTLYRLLLVLVFPIDSIIKDGV